MYVRTYVSLYSCTAGYGCMVMTGYVTVWLYGYGCVTGYVTVWLCGCMVMAV